MTYSGQRREQILKLKITDLKIVDVKGVPRKVAEFPAGITKKGKKEYVVITEPLQEVLDQISVIKERPGYEKYKFVSWLFPSIRSDKKRIQEPGYQQSDYTRTKDNKTCWNAVKEMAQVGGARKLLRKYYSSNAVEVVGDEAIKLTGHDLRSTLDKHYWKQQINKVVPNADKVAQLFKKKAI
jgi:integrase